MKFIVVLVCSKFNAYTCDRNNNNHLCIIYNIIFFSTHNKMYRYRDKRVLRSVAIMIVDNI